jgi:membrane protein YdbS with pleckstrin-like domain
MSDQVQPDAPRRLREPANLVSPRARLMWLLEGAVLVLVLLGVQVLWWFVDGAPSRTPHYVVGGVWLLFTALYLSVMPVWRYRVHRWEISPEAVFTRTGWLVQQRRIVPISRVQTIDTYRGPLDRLFRLANVTVTTASSAGAVKIVALDADTADRVVGQLTDIAALGAGDAT